MTLKVGMTGDALRGGIVAGHKTHLFIFISDQLPNNCPDFPLRVWARGADSGVDLVPILWLGQRDTPCTAMAAVAPSE